jgi:hypothetical protein
MEGRAGNSCARATYPLSSLLVSRGPTGRSQLLPASVAGSSWWWGHHWVEGPVSTLGPLTCGCFVGQVCLLSCVLSLS